MSQDAKTAVSYHGIFGDDGGGDGGGGGGGDLGVCVLCWREFLPGFAVESV